MSKIQKLATGLFAIITSKTPRFVASQPENLIYQGFILDEDDKFLYLSIDKVVINQVIPKSSIAGIELYSEEDVEIVQLNDIHSILEQLEELPLDLSSKIDEQIQEVLPDANPAKTPKKNSGLH